MRLKWIIGVATAFGLAMTANAAHAKDCDFEDGGYCIPSIVEGTITQLKVGDLKAGWIEFSADEKITGVDGLEYYEKLWEQLIESGKATEEEQTAVFEKAEESGGTKIGGVNLVVLAAGTLQHLVDKKLMTREEAQAILNEAKE